MRRVAPLLLSAALAFSLSGCGKEEAQEAQPSGGLVLGYAEGVTVVDDESALQAAVDEMNVNAQEEMVLSYQGLAVSEDGLHFTCYIANSDANEYDMFLALYGDGALTDELFLSELVRPGEAFREITLNHALEPGVHTAYLAFTQVEDDHATIHGQCMVTIQMEVS